MLNLWMLQLGVKMLLGTNVTVDQIFSGHSMRVEMSLGHSVGRCFVKVPLVLVCLERPVSPSPLHWVISVPLQTYIK
jgi:hypothetical protein